MRAFTGTFRLSLSALTHFPIWGSGAIPLVLSLAVCGGAFAQTPVERGDVLFISVTGAPELTRDAKVDVDGRIRLPLIGGIDVAGSEVDAIEDKIETALRARNILLDPVVLVEVSGYRPVYVGGAVKVSGAIPFLPGLTVRHALMAAGGTDSGVDEEATNIGQVVEYMARQRAAQESLTALDSQIARLRIELARAEEDVRSEDTPQDASARIPGGTEAEGVNPFDSALLEDIDGRHSADRSYNDTAVSLAQLELEILTQQATLQADEATQQKDDLETTRSMVERGLVPLPRLKEQEREVSRLARDLLENQAFAARARQSIESLRHQTGVADIDRRIAAREDLRAALQERTALTAELEILRGHLLLAGRAGPEMTALVPQVEIYRRIDGVSTPMPATLDTDIQPGDMIEVSLPELPTETLSGDIRP